MTIVIQYIYRPIIVCAINVLKPHYGINILSGYSTLQYLLNQSVLLFCLLILHTRDWPMEIGRIR